MQVILIGKDFGAAVVSLFTLLHQDRVLSFVTIGVPFMPPRPPSHHNQLPEGFYIKRWKVCPTSSVSFKTASTFLTIFLAGAWPGWSWLRPPWCKDGGEECVHLVLQKWNTNSTREPRDHGLGWTIYSSPTLVHRQRSCYLWGLVWEIRFWNGVAGSLQVLYKTLIVVHHLLKIGLWNDSAAFDSKFLGRWVRSWI